MCGIFGIGFFKGHKLTDPADVMGVVSSLLRETESRGRDASGISIMREREVNVLRRPMSGSSLVRSEAYSKFMRDNIVMNRPDNNVMSIIGHCRAKTKGTEQNNYNNHPIVVEDIVGVHNGVISNDDELFDDFKHTLKRIAKVDTEIIFQMINYFADLPNVNTSEAITRAAEKLQGSFACGVHNAKHPYNLYLFGSPTHILYYRNVGVVLFASTVSFIEVAFENFLDIEEEGIHFSLDNDEGVAYNLHKGTFSKFTYERKRWGIHNFCGV